MNGTTLYTDGTLDLTNGSNSVIGHGTVWTALVDGDVLIGPDGKWYELTFVNDTAATADRGYEGATVAGATCTILKMSTARDSVRTATQQLSQISAAYRKILNLTGVDSVLKLNKSADANDAGLRLQTNGADKIQIGAFGDGDLGVQYLKDGTWTKALGVSATDGTFEVLSQLILSGIINPPAISADQNDYAPAGIDVCNVVRLASTTNVKLTGLAGGKHGRIIALLNPGTTYFFLEPEDAGSVAANRFTLESETAISPNQVCLLFYDTDDRWKLLSAAGNGGGEKGYSPVVAVVDDGSRRVMQIQSWTGGQGIPPSSPHYIGAAGLTDDITQAIDVRGQEVELQNTGTMIQWKTVDAVAWNDLATIASITGPRGYAGWSPQYAVATDGNRKVLQVASWTGGEGAAPAAPKYVGLAGLVDDITQAIDIRGPQGIQGVQGQGIQPNATGTLTDRAANDAAAKGFVFMQTDVTPFNIYVKNSATSGDWSAATPVSGGDMKKADNLSGLASPSTARTNLGLGDLATKNQSDLPDPVAMAIVFGS